jgi:hypothetical protein
MKSPLRIPGFASLIFLVSGLSAQTPERTYLIDQNFESPTNLTVAYPPAKNEQWRQVAPGLGASARPGSSIELTYGERFGLDLSGGIYGVVKTPIIEFMQFNFSNLPMTMLREDVVMTKPLRSIELELDAKVAVGKSIAVTLQMTLPKTFEPGFESWKHALPLGKINGTGEYHHYKFTGADLTEDGLTAFVKYIRDLYLNGYTDPKADLVFSLARSEWEANSEFLFDNAKLSIIPR